MHTYTHIYTIHACIQTQYIQTYINKLHTSTQKPKCIPESHGSLRGFVRCEDSHPEVVAEGRRQRQVPEKRMPEELQGGGQRSRGVSVRLP